jgi:GNAT superfamily N-acetyltransferase
MNKTELGKPELGKPEPGKPCIRPATREDIPALLRLIVALAEYEKLSHMVVADEAMLERELFGEGSRAEALVCISDERAVGMAIYFHNFSTFLGRKGLYLEDLFVEPAYRGRGFGKALLLALARIAHERGCGRFEWMVLDWNTPSIRFYESLGAIGMQEWRLFRLTGEALAKLAREAA